jgi:hypothetical protein
VREFHRSESVTLLRTLAPDVVSEPEADRVAAAVGDLPSAPPAHAPQVPTTTSMRSATTRPVFKRFDQRRHCWANSNHS